MPKRRSPDTKVTFTCPVCGHKEKRSLIDGLRQPIQCQTPEKHPLAAGSDAFDGFDAHELAFLEPLPPEVAKKITLPEPGKEE